MKICNVILTQDYPLYNFFDKIKREYLESKREDFLFVYNGTDNSKHNLANKTYNYPSRDYEYNSGGIPVMIEKFMAVACSGLLSDYDFIVKTNSSTFANLDVISELLKNIKSELYMGFFHPDWNFCSGACTVFSKDVFRKLVTSAPFVDKSSREEDVVIGQLMQQCRISKTFLPRACFESHIQDTHIKTPPLEEIAEALKQPQIRIRNNSNREVIDVGIWNHIAQLTLGKRFDF